MRWLIVSDVHEAPQTLWRAIEEQPTARTVIFLGDGLRYAEEAEEQFPDRTFRFVPGNCDFGGAARYPAVGVEDAGGRRVFFTHGHRYGVKSDLTALEAAARAAGADIALFGHTHQPYEQYEDGLWLLNPGSLGYGRTYGTLDITPQGVLTAIVRMT